jgi:hypothetical protein
MCYSNLRVLGYGHWGMNTLERIPTKRIVEQSTAQGCRTDANSFATGTSLSLFSFAFYLVICLSKVVNFLFRILSISADWTNVLLESQSAWLWSLGDEYP